MILKECLATVVTSAEKENTLSGFIRLDFSPLVGNVVAAEESVNHSIPLTIRRVPEVRDSAVISKQRKPKS